MHRLVFGFIFLAALGVAQTRTDTFDASRVTVDTLQLSALPDGGCQARWCGSLTSSEGTHTLRECTDPLELRGAAARATCRQQLEAGAKPVTAAMRFAVDGGAP